MEWNRWSELVLTSPRNKDFCSQLHREKMFVCWNSSIEMRLNIYCRRSFFSSISSPESLGRVLQALWMWMLLNGIRWQSLTSFSNASFPPTFLTPSCSRIDIVQVQAPRLVTHQHFKVSAWVFTGVYLSSYMPTGPSGLRLWFHLCIRASCMFAKQMAWVHFKLLSFCIFVYFDTNIWIQRAYRHTLRI